MAGSRRRNPGNGLEAWPGYVDALSTLLMVIIFVLLVFVLAQGFLSVALSGRDKALDQVKHQLAEMSDMLSLERSRSQDLQLSVANLTKSVADANAARDSLDRQVAALTEQLDAATARAAQLQGQLQEQTGRADAAATQATRTAADLATARQQIEEMHRQAQALDQTVQADKATIEARLSELARLADQTRALTALRDQLEQQVKDAAARATTEEQRRVAVAAVLAQEASLGDSARAQVALLTQQVDQLRTQLSAVAKALSISESAGRDKDAQITNLGQRLNAALAAKVEELQQYRSDFFGKLRQVLAGRPGIQVVGDRFVFQSEVLFPTASADVTAAGEEQIRLLAIGIRQIAAEIPADVNWILRVDGHADRQKLTGAGAFSSNWELSAARAIAVVKLLIDQGVPANHLAATAFGDTQPLDPADTPQAYARNRRIELRLTDR